MLSNLEANEKLTAEITAMISNLECSGCGEICSSNEINTFILIASPPGWPALTWHPFVIE